MKYKITIKKSRLNYYLDFAFIFNNNWYTDYHSNLNSIEYLFTFGILTDYVKILEKKVLKYYE